MGRSPSPPSRRSKPYERSQGNERSDRSEKRERIERNDRGERNDRQHNSNSRRDRYADLPPSSSSIPNQQNQQNHEKEKEKPKETANFGVSGALTAEANTFKGVVLKYSEPQEARKPTVAKYRLYTFKGKEQIDMIQVSRQSAYLFGRDRLVADIPVDHPSISKQHAVLQYRLVDSAIGRVVKAYLIDLDSGKVFCGRGQAKTD
ncbi:UNVERIFIED_CONTAM: hypothetical protein HDU68_011693 [Siphonaria sp. JEL0065]|nr:hypothetical protein HDU68_011693 [Siphonaria sp. JEL0065]